VRVAMLFALSTGHEIGLAATGGAFVLFALVSAVVLPRYSADFPGRALPLYIVVCLAFFAATISAVLIFGKEKKEAHAATPAPTPAAPTAGSPIAGKAVFTSAGCSACHTFTAAGSTGTVGPNLNKLAAYAKQANLPLAQFIKEAITKPPAPYVPPGYPTNVMPTSFGKSLTTTQLTNLVAFLNKGP
jgi:cytochrome c551/c552